MNTSKLILKSISLLALSLFAAGCIPNAPTGGNPTPQTDTTVIYKLINKVVVDYNQSTFNSNGIPIDIDSNGVDDLHFDSYNGNYGYANTNIYSYTGTELAIKNDTTMANNGFKFNLNEVIDTPYFTFNRLIFGTGNNAGGSQTVYAGFRLTQNDGLHYGWMKFKMDVTFNGLPPWAIANTIKLTIQSYAYKKAPNTPILAGKY